MCGLGRSHNAKRVKTRSFRGHRHIWFTSRDLQKPEILLGLDVFQKSSGYCCSNARVKNLAAW